jgi:membrane-bound lytic murein transglycosylase B
MIPPLAALFRPALVAVAVVALVTSASAAEPLQPALGMVAAADAATARSPSVALSFSQWLARFRAKATAAGISAKTLDRAFRGVTPDERILQKNGAQAEHELPIWDYIDGMASEKRVTVGRQKLAEMQGVLDAVEAFYAVPREVVVAVWGIETSYGTNLGDKNIIRSLATLAWGGGRRAKFGEQQLIAALKILQKGDVPPEMLTGSWAGAMGHTQFIPTTFLQYAVDFDKDGRRDIWTDYFDALGSTANYLVKSGWRQGEPWGYPVVLPQGFDYGLAGLDKGKSRPVGDWAARGVVRIDGEPMRRMDLDAALILPAGARGPGFMVFRNFRAILRYNAATAYALAVGQLSDTLKGRRTAELPWPRQHKPLGRTERKEMQQLLTAAGYGLPESDGFVGARTRAALRLYQKAAGLPADGFPSREVLLRLRAGKS